MAQVIRNFARQASGDRPILPHRAQLCSSAVGLANASSNHVVRKPGLIGLLLVLLIGSFFLTLWLCKTPVSPLERLASSHIGDLSELIDVAVSAGLHRSFQVIGKIEIIRRINKSEVAITGWLAEPSEAKPITVLIFVRGTKVAATYTHGERPDITKAMHLAFGAEQNVMLEAQFECASQDRPVIVGLGTSEQYFYLPLPPCP